MKVTRIAYSRGLNAAKYALLTVQAGRLGRVRSLVWDRYGSVAGARLRDREVRDGWMADGTAAGFGVLANAWKETVRDTVADIAACREAAKAKVRRAVAKRTADPVERKRLYGLLKADRWAGDAYLSRMMRKHWRRGHNRTANQIIIRADNVRTFTLTEGGDVWLNVPGLLPRTSVPVPLNTTVAPSGTLRVILRAGRVEVHYQIGADTMPSSQRPCGDRTIGVDKGYTETLTDSDGQAHGARLGRLLTTQSDYRKAKGRARARLRSVANQAAQRGDHAKADRIARYNLGTVKRDRQDHAWRQKVRTETFTAVHAVVGKAGTVVAEDLTKTFTRRKSLGRNMNRRLAAWTKGVTAEALQNVSERRGSALVMINAAYTSQVDPRTGLLAARRGDRLHCPGGEVWQADHAAAINILHRASDPDITLHTPHTRVKQILLERADRQRIRLPIQDSRHHPVPESEPSELAHAPVSNDQEAGRRP
jgi:IS605 OrfB family transposase